MSSSSRSLTPGIPPKIPITRSPMVVPCEEELGMAEPKTEDGAEGLDFTAILKRIAALREQQHEDEKSRDYYMEGTTSIGNLEAALDIAEELLSRLARTAWPGAAKDE